MKRLTLSLGLSLIVALGFVLPSMAQVGQPKNVQVLTGKSTKEIRQFMKTITSGLGVKCNFCHNMKDYASDEKEKKRIGREFLKMVAETNSQIASINRSVMKKSKLTQVSCFTCHQGDIEVLSEAE